jgi:hypothetical protein
VTIAASSGLESDPWTFGSSFFWKFEHRLMGPLQHRSYGIHLTDPRTTPINVHHVDFWVLVDFEVEPNALGIQSKGPGRPLMPSSLNFVYSFNRRSG